MLRVSLALLACAVLVLPACRGSRIETNATTVTPGILSLELSAQVGLMATTGTPCLPAISRSWLNPSSRSAAALATSTSAKE